MIAHLLNAGVRALVASLVLGAVLIYAVGGPDSAQAGPVFVSSLGGFLVFWLVFALMFGNRVPRPQRNSAQMIEGDHDARRAKRDDHYGHDGGSHGGEAGGEGGDT